MIAGLVRDGISKCNVCKACSIGTFESNSHAKKCHAGLYHADQVGGVTLIVAAQTGQRWHEQTVMHGQVPQPRLPSECWYICWYNAMQGALLCEQHQCDHSSVQQATGLSSHYHADHCCWATGMYSTSMGKAQSCKTRMVFWFPNPLFDTTAKNLTRMV